ncbi:MAG: diguanylate cyclase (GGDEF)-like protein [Oceanicoccus sp.]|jgi:diguanylate cyclase (GGDEF)-like protein
MLKRFPIPFGHFMDLDQKFVSLHSSLMTLAHEEAFIDRDRVVRLKEILQQCAKQLDVGRVSIWVFNESNDRILCELLYKLKDNSYESGAVLLSKDYPAYFKEISKKRLINANDAWNDASTSEFAESYLGPLGITSMLDAPIFSRGKLYGVLCIEQTDEARVWDVAEMSYAASVGDTISLINEHQYWLDTKEKLEIIDRSDSLTNLENRRYFQQRLEVDRKSSQDPSRIRALIMFGLDHFTKLNDIHGAKAADNILLYLSEKFLELSQKEGCFLSRIGGDTFGFWVSSVKNEQQIEHIIESISRQVNKPITLAGGLSIEVSGSTGVFTYSDKELEGSSPIRSAEVAMYWAKNEERGSVAYFSNAWIEQTQIRQLQEDELLAAFDKRQLQAHYQPIFLASSKKMIGMEALVRWQHPARGLITPFHFLPLASELGLMPRLGRFIMRQAFMDISTLRESGADIKWVSINLSADQLYDSGLVSEVESLLNEFYLQGDVIEFEIVEELIGQDSDMVRGQLLAISNLGIKLSIDDFGTGYSSLSRLKHLPVSKLKIDKSFVDGLPDSIDDQCIAQSIIGLAKGMNLDLVAEGVESLPQSDWLVEHGCDYLQGYLYAKPVDFESIQTMLFKDGQMELAEANKQ